MGMFDNWTGGKSRDDVNEAAARANALLGRGYDGAKDAYNTWYDQAQGYYQPYVQTGQRANALYSDAIGLNGADARQKFLDGYMNDPFLQHDQAMAARNTARQFNASGNFGGAAQLAAARASMDLGNTYRNQYLDRLAGMQGQGLQVAGAQSNLAYGHGNDLAQLEYGYNQQLAGNEINRGNAIAGTRNAGINNLFNAAGTLAKFMPNGGGGGDIAKMFMGN